MFFQAGVDALKEDSFGRLGMTREGMMERNLRVYRCALDAAPRPPHFHRRVHVYLLKSDAAPNSR